MTYSLFLVFLKENMKLRYYLKLSILFIIGGLLIGYGPFMHYWHNRQPQAPIQTFAEVVETQDSAPRDVTQFIQGKPVRISIPSVKIDLTVIDGFYNRTAQTWTLTNDKAQYAVITPLANNKEGNTFIYGHDTKKVFDRLNDLRPGQHVTIYADNGHRFVYAYRNSLVTSPTDDSLFYYKGAPILTLQTCTGPKSENRKLFTFDLVEAA